VEVKGELGLGAPQARAGLQRMCRLSSGWLSTPLVVFQSVILSQVVKVKRKRERILIIGLKGKA